MRSDSRLAYSTSNTDNNRMMSNNNEARYNPQDLEYDMMHRANHRE